MQKKNRKLITLLLTILLTVSLLTASLTAGANAGTGDIDGDGKITVHDVQLLQEAERGIRDLTDSQLIAKAQQTWADILARVKNSAADAPALVGGVYQIADMNDLFYMAKHPDKAYKLTANIDMKGANWTPVKLTGSLNGNNKTISNLVITTGVKNSVAKTEDQGFFAEIMANASVTNLTLKNIDIYASANSQVIGLLAGTNRGTVTGCYTIGSITDLRTADQLPAADTSVGANTIIAALIGRCINTTYTTVSKQADEPTVSDANYTVAAKLATNLADRENINVCLCATSDHAGSGTTQWQDITASYFATAAQKAHQKKVVDYMYQMGTVQWKPAETITYTANGTETVKTWKSGTTYTGLPYNQLHGSLERFNYALNNWSALKSANTNWATSIYNKSETETENDGYNGWVRYMGNDCSGAVYQAWMKVSPSNKDDNHQGVMINVTKYMIPTDKNVGAYGVQKLGNYTIPEDYLQGSADVQQDSDTLDIWNANDTQTMYDAFALARKGDVLVCWLNGTNASTSEDFAEGHSRMVAEDPVVIRTSNGDVDAAKSYFVVHEQGGRQTARAIGTPVTGCSWGINYRYYFTDLDVDIPEDVKNENNSSRCYLPITCRALRKDDVKNTWAEALNVTDPMTGKLHSNYYIINATVTVKDSSGATVVTKTAYNNAGAGDRQLVSGGRAGDDGSYGRNMVLENYFGDIMKGLPAGGYTFQIEGLLANGHTVNWTTKESSDTTARFWEGTQATSFTYVG